MEIQVGDRFIDQGEEWEVLTHPAAMHGGKSLRASVQPPPPRDPRAMTWSAPRASLDQTRAEVGCGCRRPHPDQTVPTQRDALNAAR
jgi:hypothetical protein